MGMSKDLIKYKKLVKAFKNDTRMYREGIREIFFFEHAIDILEGTSKWEELMQERMKIMIDINREYKKAKESGHLRDKVKFYNYFQWVVNTQEIRERVL
ncbi:hypothetical protein [Bacillus subtilis]|uniref:hypothetical protein n=1 Tax=Bacillus subtilis TaxID=1423 RepID=UPI001CFAFD9C|nr:hypothetical protein [Bacillus subtilis]MCB4337693.1 hypothetical protein [Bacillus subtilis]